MMKKLLLLIALVAASFMTSCYNTRLYVGSVTTKEPLVQVNKEWNSQFIAGLVTTPSAKMNPAEYVDNAPNYVVKTNQTFLTGLVSVVTLGIYTPTQTIYYIPLKDFKGTPAADKIVNKKK